MNCQKRSKANNICLCCCAIRDACFKDEWEWENKEQKKLFLYEALAKKGVIDHLDTPIIKGYSVWTLHFCIEYACCDPFWKRHAHFPS